MKGESILIYLDSAATTPVCEASAAAVADVLQHCLFDPGYVAKKEKDRFKKLKKELGIKK